MNVLVVAWSMIAAACAMLGLIQLFIWMNHGRSPVYPLSAVMAFSAATVTLLEMTLFLTPEPARYQQLLVWQNLCVSMVIIPMVWAVKSEMPQARTWAALVITILWILGLAVNFFLPGNLTFAEIQSVEPRHSMWGDVFFFARGTPNDWKWLVDLTVILIPLYVIDAAWRDPKRGEGKRGLVITLGVVFFTLFAGGQAILVDSGLHESHYMIGAAFLSMVLALTWVVARDAVRAKSLAVEIIQARQETERLMRVNLLGEVAAALAHELSQPLAAILGNAQAAQKFLARPNPDLAEIESILTDIVRDDKRARDIIMNMRLMLRGDDRLYESVDLKSAIREILSFISGELDKNGISIQFNSDDLVPDVNGGRVALQQVILNLLLNAEQALRELPYGERKIHLYLRESQGGAELEVRDFGPGIAESVRQSLFEPFVSTKEGSLGMGLAICRRIVENHGGRLTAETASEGGTRFRVWLPAEK